MTHHAFKSLTKIQIHDQALVLLSTRVQISYRWRSKNIKNYWLARKQRKSLMCNALIKLMSFKKKISFIDSALQLPSATFHNLKLPVKSHKLQNLSDQWSLQPNKSLKCRDVHKRKYKHVRVFIFQMPSDKQKFGPLTTQGLKLIALQGRGKMCS